MSGLGIGAFIGAVCVLGAVLGNRTADRKRLIGLVALLAIGFLVLGAFLFKNFAAALVASLCFGACALANHYFNHPAPSASKTGKN